MPAPITSASRSASVDASRAIAAATPATTTAAWLLVVIEFLVLVGVVVAARHTGPLVAGVALLVVVLVLAADAGATVGRGQGLAFRLVGVVMVAREDDAPLGWARILPPRPARLATLRGGAHPVDPRRGPVVLVALDARRDESSSRVARSRPGADIAVPDHHASTRDAQPRIPVLPPGMEPAPPPPRSLRGPVTLTVDGSARHAVTGTVIIGRRPAAQDGSGTIVVNDLSRTLSKSHLRLEVQPEGQISVTDLGSTNGSAIVAPEGSRVRLAAHVPREVPLGASVEIGDHMVTFSHGGHS
ncbi:FHA domain-containing protein [Demequina sp. NBRC 110055]|uniref:FHA domain-containing protein n=1 Tax=Demequina sp. NBRC 110055 TaxID=1570344 RepID=UPI0009FF0658|nr:FHA domain-containing protein [Demequina sp. NBRC 110055]